MEVLKAKKGFLLRRLGTEYMIVAIGEASKVFNGMIKVNETGAFYWKELEKGTTENQLVEKTLERFEGADTDMVRRDITVFLKEISVAVDHDTSNS